LYFEHKNVAVWDVRSGTWHLSDGIGISKGRFAEVRLRPDPLPPEYDSAEYYLLPGFIDAHVHLASYPLGDHIAGSSSGVSTSIDQIKTNLRTAIAVGITCVRDVGSLRTFASEIGAWRASEIHKGALLPRVFTAGTFITRKGGHCHGQGLETVDKQSLLTAVKELASTGASFIKIMNDPVVFTAEEIFAARSLAHQLGMNLAVHAYTHNGAAIAIEGGADTIEHPGEYSDEIVQCFADRGIGVVSTFVAALDTVIDPKGARADDLFDTANLNTFQSWYRACCDCIPRLYKGGVVVLAGTDAGFPGTDYDSLIREMASLRMLGVSIPEMMKSTTIHPARALGVAHTLGEIRVGACADCVLYMENPFNVLDFLWKPCQVFCEGVPLWAERQLPGIA
jgi:imidazolonepropionase-like amidohydrolase